MPENPADFLVKTTQNIEYSGFLNSDSLLVFFSIMKFIFIVLSIFFFLHIIYLIFKINKTQGKFEMYKDVLTRKTPPPYKGEFVVRWAGVTRRIQTMQEAEYKLDIIE